MGLPAARGLAGKHRRASVYRQSQRQPSFRGRRAGALRPRDHAMPSRGVDRYLAARCDTAFSQAAHFDRWDDAGVRFVFGYDAYKPMVARAEGDEASDYRELVRKADAVFNERKRHAKQPRVKEEIVREREYRNLRLEREDVAEFEHRPTKAKRSYRFVVLRKTIIEERGQLCLGQNYRYFFYVTHDRAMTREQVVGEANGRCNQENLLAQLKSGVPALRAPLNTLESNWASMVIASLAWSLKAWFALMVPVAPRWREADEADKERVLRMEFRSFVQRFILLPAQILCTGRTLVYRLLAFRPELPIFFRFLDAL